MPKKKTQRNVGANLVMTKCTLMKVEPRRKKT